jgi:heptosyltransferase-2
MSLQAIEIAVRSVFVRALFGLLAPRPHAPEPDWTRGSHRVLFIRDDGIGDMVLSIEVLRAIAASNPAIELEVLASPQNAGIARQLPFVRRVIVHQRGRWLRAPALWRELRARRYDLVIDGRIAVSAVNTKTALLLLATRARWRMGMGGRRNDAVYTHRLSPRPAGHWSEFIAQLASPFGVRVDDRDWRPRIPLTSDDRAAADSTWRGLGDAGPRVLMNISTGEARRRWTDDGYRALARHVRAVLPSARFLVLGTGSDRPAARELAVDAGARAWEGTLGQAMALIATADLVITPDTAVIHIASAFERPLVALMRRGAEYWGPYRTTSRLAVGPDAERLAPLPIATAIQAADEVIAAAGLR